MASGSTESVPVVQAALRQLDRAASKGIIHPNNAARHKSRLQRHLDALLQQN
ncbi:MAG: 30S ribosomal protein S20 [Chloroflexi bacterium]|nr:30S ribosomal protein S20 [Chloroflexota bacterium]